MGSLVRVRSPGEAAMDLIRSEYPEYHPLIALARLAHDPRLEQAEGLDGIRLATEINKAILPYVAPRLANVEVKAEVSEDRRIIVSLFEERALPDGGTVGVEVPCVTDVTDLVPLDP